MSAPNTVTVSSGESTPQNSALTELAFGPFGPNDSQTDTHHLTFGSDTTAGTIDFTGGAGAFRGDADGAWAPAPDGINDSDPDGVQTDYLAAVAESSLTITFADPQVYFGLLWGSMSVGNTLTFYNGSTPVFTVSDNGTQLVATDLITNTAVSVAGAAITDQGNYYVGINIPGGYTSVDASSTSGGFEFANITYAATTVDDPFTGTGVHSTVPYDPTDHTYLCFLEGTKIAVPGGDVAVESLRPGMLVTTADGKAEAVRWVGVRAVSTRFADPLRAYPVRIAAGALEDGVPSRDLLLSPDHAVLVDGVLIQAAALLDSNAVRREAEMPGQFTYYHVELASHGLILAEGTPAETFVDNADRGHFDNWDTHPDHGAVVEMELPRAKSARQIPAGIRTRLAARNRKAA